MGFEDEVEQSLGRPCRLNDGRSKQTNELTSSIVPRGTSFHRSVELEFPLIACDPGRLSCRCDLPGPSEFSTVNPYAVHCKLGIADLKEGNHAAEEAFGRRDCLKATPSGCVAGAGTSGRRCRAIVGCDRDELRDELLNGEIFYSLREAQVVIEQWRRHYNTIRPHSSLGYRPPAPEVVSHAVSQPIALRPPLN